MIESLHIENVAVVKTLDVDFGAGLTVLTGETGAGKSIIIDSLNLLLGGRADRELIRSGESRAEVSALFGDLSDRAMQTLTELGFSVADGSVMLSRSLTASSSSARVNGRAVTLSVLREIAEQLFNIHGQNDNQQLLDPRNHVHLLDAYADCGALLEKYRVLYGQILHKRTEIDSLDRDAREQYRMREMLRYQVAEIDAAKLKHGEEEALVELIRRLRDAERIDKSRLLVSKALKGGDKGMGAIYLADRAAGALEAIAESIPDATELVRRLREVCYELEDIAETARDLTDFGDENPTLKLDRAEGRLDTIERMKKKYGSTVDEVLAFRNDAAERLDRIDHAEERREDMVSELNALSESADSLAVQLREIRKKSAGRLQDEVRDTLAFLDMPKVRFEVSVLPSADFGPFGRDEVEFLIATNPGEPMMPMAKIASGGELARIMLSLKNVLNRSDGIDTVIFDEVDTGISGKTSRKVGIKLKEIGRESQVICVTHSAQIASLAHNHLYIAKREIDGRAETVLTTLTREGREEEIARILGGIDITEAQRLAAREMIAEGEQYG